MKVMMIIKEKGNISITSKTVVGGTERFAQLMMLNNPSIILTEIPTIISKSKKTKNFIEQNIIQHKPDLIVSHLDEKSLTINLLKYDIPHIWILNTPIIRTIIQYELMHYINDYISQGGNLYFVSELQYDYFNEMHKRIMKTNLKQIRGYISPCYSLEEWSSSNDKCEYDLVTVGRNAVEKNPFLLHQKAKDTKFTSLVITNTLPFLKNNSYANKNTHWKFPQDIIYDLPHDQVIHNLRKGKVFVSTMPEESWGITALEALCNGLPCILFYDKEKRHASEIIADSKNDYRLLSKKCCKKEFEDVVSEMIYYADKNREDISLRHRKKHSKEKWIKNMNDIFNSAIQNHVQRNNLNNFFE